MDKILGKQEPKLNCLIPMEVAREFLEDKNCQVSKSKRGEDFKEFVNVVRK